MEDLVSIIIPTFNNESSIHASLRSILSQTYENIEVLILDNYSTDKTIKIVNTYFHKTKKLKIIRHITETETQAILFGIKHITGKYVLIASPENIYSLNFIEYAIKVLKETKSNIFSCEFISKNENIIRVPFENDIYQKKEKTTIKTPSSFLESIYRPTRLETTLSLSNKIIDISVFSNLTESSNPYFFKYILLKQKNKITVSNQILVIKLLIDIFYNTRCYCDSDFDLINFIETIMKEKKSNLPELKKQNLSIIILKELLKIRKKFNFYYLEIDEPEPIKSSLDKKFSSLYKYYIKTKKTNNTIIQEICKEYINELNREKERNRYPYLYC